MPVERVPVVHKFGIISHTQRLALEDRLTKKSQATEPPRTFSRTRRIPYEVTEDFIAKFNDSNEEDRRELEGFALKMISRAKRRAGILAGGKGDHVDLGKSWTELGLLAQCTSRVIQEEALELLVTSLGHAPPAVDQLPSLLYLAKSCLHWLRKCVMSPSCLRTAELKLVKVGYLTFSRLYYHNMTQDLKGYQEEKRSLLKYLSNLPDQQEEAYKSFPGVLLAFRYIKEVGHLICTGCGESSQKGSSVIEPAPEGATAEQETEPAVQERPAVEAPVMQAAEGGRVGLPLLLEEEEEEEPYQGSGDMGFNEAMGLSLSHSPAAASSSIHDLSPTLWHALDVWRSVMHRGTGLRQALEGLSMCGTGLTAEFWLDVCCAFQVLTEVSKHDITVLRTFQALAAGLFSRPAGMSDAHARHIHLCNNCLSSITLHHQAKGFTDDDLNFNMDKTQTASGFISVDQTPSFVRGLRDFAGLDDRSVKHSEAEDDAESVTSRSDASSEASFADVSSVESGHRGRFAHANEKSASNMSKTYKKTRKTVVDKGQLSSDSEDEVVEKSRKSQTQSPKQTSVPKKETESSVRVRGGTAVRFNVQDTDDVNTEGGVPKAQMERSLTKDSLFSAHTRSSVSIPLAEEDDKSSVGTGTSQFSDAAGLTGWRWELAYIYTDCMTSVCMNGQSSAIQKTALLGSEANRKVTVYGKRNVMSTEGLGLLDLLKIKFPVGEGKEHKDWSWRVRFAAVQGLVRICRHCSGDNTRDGMCGVAWTQLMRHHSLERDVRVLEAWKLAQIDSDLDNKLPLLDIANSFPSWAASRLSAVLLPPLPPVVPQSSRSRSRARATLLSKPAPVVKKGPKRPSLRQEILLATAVREPQPDYRSRRNQDLMLVIEDQWRKQLHEEQEQEEADRRMAEASRIKGIVVKEGRRSRQGREADERGKEAGVEVGVKVGVKVGLEVGVERERSRSSQELMEDV